MSREYPQVVTAKRSCEVFSQCLSATKVQDAILSLSCCHSALWFLFIFEKIGDERMPSYKLCQLAKVQNHCQVLVPNCSIESFQSKLGVWSSACSVWEYPQRQQRLKKKACSFWVPRSPDSFKSLTTCGRGLVASWGVLHSKPLPHWVGVSAVWPGADGCSRSAAPLSPPPRCRPPPPHPHPHPPPPPPLPASRCSPARPAGAPPDGARQSHGLWLF